VNSDVEDRTPEISGPPPSSPPTRPRTASEEEIALLKALLVERDSEIEEERMRVSDLEEENKEMKGVFKKVVGIRNQGRKSPNPDSDRDSVNSGGSTGSNKSQSSEAMDVLEHDMERLSIYSDFTTEEMDDVSSFVMISNPEDDASLSSLIYYPSPESPRYSDESSFEFNEEADGYENGVQLKEVPKKDVKRINPYSQSSRNAFDEEDVKISSPKVPSSVDGKSPKKAAYKPSTSNKTKNQSSSEDQLKNSSGRMFNREKFVDVDLGEDNPKSNQTADIENQRFTPPRPLPGGDGKCKFKKKESKKSYPKNDERGRYQKLRIVFKEPERELEIEPEDEGINW